MMTLPEFELHRPSTVEEAVSLAGQLNQQGQTFDYIAGGTDLLQNYKNRLNCAPHLISLKGIDSLHSHDNLNIGGLVPLRTLEQWGNCPQGILDALHELASPIIRETATVGGNLLVDTRCFFFNQSAFWRHSLGYCLKAEGDVCHVVPQKEICYATTASDLAPIMMVLDASIELAGPDGTRTVPLRSFYIDEGRAVYDKKPDELLTKITLSKDATKLKTGYQKLRLRSTMDFPAMGVAIGVSVDKEGILQDLRIAVGGISCAPLYLEDICSPYIGQKMNATLLDQLSSEVMKSTQPKKNLVVPTRYRKKMVRIYTRRLLGELLGEPQVTALHP